MVNRTRVRKAVDQQYGAGTYDEILVGKQILTVDGETYSVEELKEKNIYIREDAEIQVKAVVVPKPVKVSKPVEVDFMVELEKRIGKDRLADVRAGTAVLAINGTQVVARDLTDQKLYSHLSDKDKLLVIQAACGG